MALLNPKLERLKLFINEPLLRKDQFTPRRFEPREAIMHITNPVFETARDMQRVNLIRQDDLSLAELKEATERVIQFQMKIDSLEVTANDFSKKVDHNLAIIDSDEKKITKMIEALNLRFHNLNMLYERIEQSKKILEEYLTRFDTVKNLTEENLDLKYKLTRAAEEKSKVLIERPILRREEVSMLENDMFNLRNQNEYMKKELQVEKDKNSALVTENQALAKDRRELLDRLNIHSDEKNFQYKEYRDLFNQKAELEQKLKVTTEELEKLRTTPKLKVSIWDNPTYEAPNQQSAVTLKKLMDQNEKLITEINTLKNERSKLPSLDKITNPDARDIYMAHQRLYDIEKKNVELIADLTKAKNELDHQKSLNIELTQKLTTQENRFQQMNIEYSALKDRSSNKRDTFLSSPRRIFDREYPNVSQPIFDNSTIINQSMSPKTRPTTFENKDEMEKLRIQLEAEKRWSEHLALELQKQVNKNI